MLHFSLLNICLLIFILTFNIIHTEDIEYNCEQCTYNLTINKCVYNQGGTTVDGTASLYNCSDYCRPHYYLGNSGKCYNCSNVFQTSSSRKYIISGGECKVPSTCNRLIIETNECVDECGDESYEFGEYCYNECNETKYNLIESLNHQCKCKNNWKIIEDTIQEKKYYRCVEFCPLGYYDKETNICTGKCKNSKDKIMPDNGCTNFCGTYNKKLYNSNDGEKYCVDVCPDSAPFYYNSEIPNKEIECLTKCNNQDFYNSTTKECIQECQTTSLIDFENNIYECINTINKCPDSFPYKYKNSCLRYCSDTRKINISQTTTYIFIGEETEGEGEGEEQKKILLRKG